jgi:sulfatase maturation enzyme AslB (radical SAM superfamily)
MDKIFWLQPVDTKLGHWQRKIAELSNSQTFCVLPWIHFATRPNGDMRLCCNSNSSGAGFDHEIGLVKNETGRPANFGTETPMSAWNNEYMRSVRTTMMEGNIPSSCNKCFDEEHKGVVSKRMWETGTWVEEGIDIPELIAQTQEDGTVPEQLVYLDLRLGHTCNLKCIMCSPHDSSQWVNDHKKVFPLFKHSELKTQMSWDKKSFNNFWHENPDFWKEMYAQIPNLKQVYFAGGEPLMIREHKWFLEEIIRQGYADKILIRYNTNGLLVDEEIIDLWSKFKKVKVGFSIDAVGDRNWYIRYPSEWSTIEKNLHRLDNTPDNIHVSIATAIQVLNIKHLADFARWKVTQNFKKINFGNITGGIQAGGGIFNMHLLYIPTFLSIRCLPESDKAEVRRSFAELANWLHENYRQDEDFWKHNPYGWRRWQAVLDFMDAEDHTDLLPAFKEYISVMDSQRKLNFKEIFPELTHLL